LNLTTKNACPVCSMEMDFNWETKEIPHFGETMIIAGVCCCGYRHSDTILLSQKEPARHALTVSSIEDLDSRVIRSPSGTIRIPELGIDVEPGPASEAYVSNVEGVLERIRGIVEFATRSARETGDIEKTKQGDRILENLEMSMQGLFNLTVIIEDPMGNSAIGSDKAVRSALTDEEIAGLKTGMILLDI
jgi:zinc finger protein